MVVSKIRGDNKPADLMTQHIPTATVMRRMRYMGLQFERGRANIAAKLHALQAGGSYGDSWEIRGTGGILKRRHCRKRHTLFTPTGNAGGPRDPGALSSWRRTVGTTSSGRKFEVVDSWRSKKEAHCLTREEWVAYTIFFHDRAKLGRGICLANAL